MKVRLVWVAILSSVVLFTCTASGQDAKELQPFVGKWRGYATERGTSTPIEMVVQRDGSYSTVLYTQPPRTTKGRVELLDGKFRFKSSDGGAGAISVVVDSKGKRVLKAVRADNGRSTQYDEVK